MSCNVGIYVISSKDKNHGGTMSSYVFRTSKQFVAVFSLAFTLFATQGFAKEFTVNDFSDAVDVNVEDGICETSIENNCSLRAAIQQSNALEGVDTIKLPAGTYTLSIGASGDEVAARGDLDITDAVSITGNTSEDTIIDGQQLDRVFHVHGGAALTLKNLTIQNGKASSNGGGIYNATDAILKLSDSMLIENQAVEEGGALFNQGIAVIENTEFSANSASSPVAEGGAIANDRTGFMILNDSIVNDNNAGTLTSASTGGGIYNRSSEFFLTNATIGNNIAGWGGGLYTTGVAFLNDLTVTDNQATFGGGLYFAVTDESSMQKAIVSGNTANAGGGVYVDPVSPSKLLTIDLVTFSNNSTTGINIGGGMYVKQGKVNLSRSLLNANNADKGGALHNAAGELKLNNVTISGNNALTSGGGIEQNGNGSVELNNVTLADNTTDAVDKGDNIHRESGVIRLRNSIIADGAPNCTAKSLAGITSLQFNIATDDTCELHSRTNDIIINPQTDPLLEGLAENGGFSLSHALPDDSPAINSGNSPFCSKTDQRLFYRGDGKCDIGAFEANSVLASAGSLEFESSEAYQVNEDSNDGEIELPVQRTGGSQGVVTLRYTATFGTASRSDYSHSKARGELTWNDGDLTSKNITVEIGSDDDYEPTEMISVMLFNPGGGATLGDNVSANINILDDDFTPGRFRFEKEIGGKENSSSMKVSVIREEGFGTDGTVSISYSTNDDVARAGEDYVATQGSLEFAHGDVKKEFEIELIDDELWEGNERFGVILSNPEVTDAPFGGEQLATPTIETNNGSVYATIFENELRRPGKLQFTEENYTVDEDVGTVDLTIERVEGTDDDITVVVNSIAIGTATSGDDFSRVSSEISFTHGENIKTLMVTINDDDIFEEDETINIRIVGVTNGAKIGELATTTLTVKSHDLPKPGTVQFSEASRVVNKVNGNIEITINRVDGSDEEIAVMLSSANEGTAILGEDYTQAATEIIFANGETSKTLQLVLSEDNISESEETIIIKLLSATNGATIGEIDTLTLTVGDKDSTPQDIEDQGSDDQGSDDQGSDDQSTDDQSTDDQSTDDQSTDDQSTDDQTSGDITIDDPSANPSPSGGSDVTAQSQNKKSSSAGSMGWFLFVAVLFLIGRKYRVFSRN